MTVQLKYKILRIIHKLNIITGFYCILKYYFFLKGYRHIPIIGYHSVGGSKFDKDTISIEAFEKQMAFLSKNFRVGRLVDIPVLLKETKKEIPVCITFDDARKSVSCNAHKIMVKYKIPYTVFVATRFVGGKTEWADSIEEVMNIDELKELEKSGLVDFGSHTVDHISLGSINEEEVRRQLIESRIQLKKIFHNNDIKIFSYPYGGFDDFSRDTTNALKQCGYKIGVTTVPSVMNSKKKIYTLHRINLNEEDDEKEIRAKIDGQYDWEIIKNKITYIFRSKFSLEKHNIT
jgi:peptidoglycan/xylan/chitin deacetylase (PgdA/CDA1 family)